MMAGMDLGIDGRTAVVTGATRGIGAAVAERLEQEGARVVRVARSVGIDVTAPDAADRIAERAAGPVDILVNNAGTSEIKPLDELTDADFYDAFELNVMAPLRLMRHFAPLMAERGWGRIVNVTSSAGKRPSQTWPAYSVAKAGQHSLSRLFADFWAPRGVHVNAVAPGPTGTPLWRGPGGLAEQLAEREGISPEEAIERQSGKVPLGRFGDADEVAAVVVFLCSERVSWVTGAAWSADGGTWQSML
jgi:NAD(P)-dependent dehydrogenase (short-subunit alcohol dehydrogenase family)